MNDELLPRDKNGIVMRPFDVLKLFHFVGGRRKKYYMYKQVRDVELRSSTYWLRIDHLSASGDGYVIECDGKSRDDYEIVQGFYDGTSFEDRK